MKRRSFLSGSLVAPFVSSLSSSSSIKGLQPITLDVDSNLTNTPSTLARGVGGFVYKGEHGYIVRKEYVKQLTSQLFKQSPLLKNLLKVK
jgi:hypothetical protein